MKDSTKLEISKAANRYAVERGWAGEKKGGVNQLSRLSGVSSGYLSRMLSGDLNYDNGAIIGTVQWNKLAKAIDFETDKVIWPKRNTPQFIATISRLKEAKQNNIKGMIIGESGCGKTYAFERFKVVNPVNTKAITLSVLHNVRSLLDEICQAFDVERKASKVTCLKAIAGKIRNIDTTENGLLIVFDEAENASVPVLRTIKALYDQVKDYCSIILIGTPQLIRNLERMKKRDAIGIPQFVSRFKANTVYLNDIRRIDPKTNDDHTFEEFFVDIKDEGLKALIRGVCEDYRMLHDYLVPAFEKAEVMNTPLDEKFFRMINGLTL
jgi:DNA transposition AAA+ family ATPase